MAVLPALSLNSKSKLRKLDTMAANDKLCGENMAQGVACARRRSLVLTKHRGKVAPLARANQGSASGAAFPNHEFCLVGHGQHRRQQLVAFQPLLGLDEADGVGGFVVPPPPRDGLRGLAFEILDGHVHALAHQERHRVGAAPGKPGVK